VRLVGPDRHKSQLLIRRSTNAALVLRVERALLSKRVSCMIQPVDKDSAGRRADAPDSAQGSALPNCHVAESVYGGTCAPLVPLSALHQRTIAVHCQFQGRDETLLGHGVYEHDPDLGPLLRVQSAEEDAFQLSFAEASWNGQIVAGEGRGWDFLIRLSR
jgi:hypothetical protein